MTRTISCDQVVWLLDIAKRHIPKDKNPKVSRQHEMQCYAMLYEIMEIANLDFYDEAAQFNATPSFIYQWEQRKDKYGGGKTIDEPRS